MNFTSTITTERLGNTMRTVLPLRETLAAESIPMDVGLQTRQPNSDSPVAGLASITFQNLYISPRPSVKEQTDDAGQLLYINGLPTVVIADGAFGSNCQPPQTLCNELLPALLPDYAQRLTEGEDPTTVMQDLLKMVNEKATVLDIEYRAHGNAMFTFSCAIAYINEEGETKLASIGTGSDLIAVYRPAQREAAARYIQARSAVNFCLPGAVDPICAGEAHVPHQKQFLPALSAPPGGQQTTEVIQHKIKALLDTHPVTVLDLQPGDQLVACTDGVIDGLGAAIQCTAPLSSASASTSDLEEIPISRNFTATGNGIAPEQLFQTAANTYATMFAANPQDSYGDDALLMVATVPTEQQQKTIQARARMKDEVFSAYKEVIAARLEALYPWRPSLFSFFSFGHHHHNRRVAVCAAIRGAATKEQITAILQHQTKLLFTADTPPVPNVDVAQLYCPSLSRTWLGVPRNRMDISSGYYDAVHTLYLEVMSPPLAREEASQSTLGAMI